MLTKTNLEKHHVLPECEERTDDWTLIVETSHAGILVVPIIDLEGRDLALTHGPEELGHFKTVRLKEVSGSDESREIAVGRSRLLTQSDAPVGYGASLQTIEREPRHLLSTSLM